MSTHEAKAVMLLPITSAMTAYNVYPIARVDSISVGAYGGNCFVFTEPTPVYS